jgi:hypothetical protein
MLRLGPTTITLTMTEVKDFEQRRRFVRYLEREETLEEKYQVWARPTSPNVQEAEAHHQAEASNSTSSLETIPLHLHEKSSPNRSRCSSPNVFQDDNLVRHSSISTPNSAMSSTRALLLASHPAAPRAPLPPPFSAGVRVVSDSQALPSVRISWLES